VSLDKSAVSSILPSTCHGLSEAFHLRHVRFKAGPSAPYLSKAAQNSRVTALLSVAMHPHDFVRHSIEDGATLPFQQSHCGKLSNASPCEMLITLVALLYSDQNLGSYVLAPTADSFQSMQF